jgi:hypothetical protein
VCLLVLPAAQALRAAHDRYFDTSFEVVLREAEAADHSSSSSGSLAGSGGSGSWGAVMSKSAAAAAAAAASKAAAAASAARVGGTHTALLRRPAVFTLAVVWESPKVSLATGGSSSSRG